MLLRFGGFLAVIVVIFWLWCLWDTIMAPEDRVRTLPKLAWVFIVLLFFDLGAMMWLLAGRPRAAVGGRGGGGAVGRAVSYRPNTRRSGRPLAPDDDPDFLRQLDDDVRRNRRHPDTDAPSD